MEQEAALKNLEQWKLIIPLLYDMLIDGVSDETDMQFVDKSMKDIIDAFTSGDVADITQTTMITDNKIIIFQLQYKVIDF